MSHTTQIQGYTFIHNGGFDGDVAIRRPDNTMQMLVPFDALKEFMAEYVRSKLIERLEEATADEILSWDI